MSRLMEKLELLLEKNGGLINNDSRVSKKYPYLCSY